MARPMILLIMIVLIGGMVRCPGGGRGESYTLTIASTAGGNVTSPGEGVFTYARGTVVNLVAEAWDDFRFVNWSGDVGTIADINAAVTTITIEGNYSIRANFEF
jgi:hypothetical protein